MSFCLQTKGEIKVRKPFSCTVTFLNPMPVTLTQCEWQVTGLIKPSTHRQAHRLDLCSMTTTI